jgi:hypothetical protein
VGGDGVSGEEGVWLFGVEDGGGMGKSLFSSWDSRSSTSMDSSARISVSVYFVVEDGGEGDFGEGEVNVDGDDEDDEDVVDLVLIEGGEGCLLCCCALSVMTESCVVEDVCSLAREKKLDFRFSVILLF